MNSPHGPRILILFPDKRRILQSEILRLSQPRWVTPGIAVDFFPVTYIIFGLTYHIANLAVIYAEELAFQEKQVGMPADEYYLGHRWGGHYEFDAAIGLLRRLFEEIGFIIWQHFNPGPSPRPRSFEKILPCVRLPIETKYYWEELWRTIGVKIKGYRDCVAHSTPLDLGGSAKVENNDGVRRLRILIPDNPECRSRNKFTYWRQTDALEFIWESTNELAKASFELAEQISTISGSLEV